jgi:hypothetical protein
MKRLLQTLVFSLAILSLLTPLSALCSPFQEIHTEHACCGDRAQLAAPECCPDASPCLPMPSQGLDLATGVLSMVPLPAYRRVVANSQLAYVHTVAHAPILQPATVLRT